MKKRMLACLLGLMMLVGMVCPAAYAAEDEAVEAVIAQLEAIDSLQQMQDARSSYTAKNNYDITVTNEATIAAHEAARAAYESYVAEMFAARVAAQQAYDALTDAQKAQIDPALVAKLTDQLSTKLMTGTFAVTPRKDAYIFEAVAVGTGQGYEVSNYMVAGDVPSGDIPQIPQTFILVNTADGKTSWTPSGLYTLGESNYDVTYCCDVKTGLTYGTDYKRINLEDAGYYSETASAHIRAILQNAYPFVSMEEMKESLIAGGMSESFVNSLNRADLISAVQMAVWSYANAWDGAKNGLAYFTSIDVPKNTGHYFTPLHDYTCELWEWLPGKKQRSYDARAAYRVNTLAYYLCNLEGVKADAGEIIISDVEVTRAEQVTGAAGAYRLGLYVNLNHGGDETDDLKVIVTSYHMNEEGKQVNTSRFTYAVEGRSQLQTYALAMPGDTICVEVEGVQTLERGVYFYEPEGGRDVSQSLVGVGYGETPVYAQESFEFSQDIVEQGLQIFKTETDTGAPLSDIIFKVYKAVPAEGEGLSATPTEEELAQYRTEENLVGTLTTDATGYAAISLEEGTYLVVEEHNAEKTKAPVSPFYVTIPMEETVESEDGTTTVKTVSLVAVYPKNDKVTPPEGDIIVPPTPDKVTGHFEILKHDGVTTDKVLPGAVFEVYQAAKPEDTDTTTVVCNGVQYAVVPVLVDGQQLTLTTDENGMAQSPELVCGTYFLVETHAPDGYNRLSDAVSVTVFSSVMTNVEPVKIANMPGNELPETGGMGTGIFVMTGSLLTLAAAVLLITKKRMGENH